MEAFAVQFGMYVKLAHAYLMHSSMHYYTLLFFVVSVLTLSNHLNYITSYTLLASFKHPLQPPIPQTMCILDAMLT